ncbi:hypothetical protein ABDK00_010655 [Niabella insulamsoli]|uniref:hypothetical protein n=1 Tax=Niabella insulamsoli TaxID=3144874 RepID=UPI0031FC1333
MKNILFTIAFILFTTVSFGQYYDSVSFVSAAWRSQKIGKKAKLYQFHFNHKNLFRADEHISYIKIQPGRVNEFDVAAERKELRTVSDFSQAKRAIAAVNGNFFDVKNGGAVDFTKVDHEVVNENKVGTSGQLGVHQKAAIVVDDGVVAIKKWDGSTNWPQSLQEADVM